MVSPLQALPDLATALAALPGRRDFAFSADGRRAAWIVDDMIEWTDSGDPDSGDPADGDSGGGGSELRHFDPGFALPPGTSLELLEDGRIGICRPTDAGVEVVVVDAAEADGPPCRPIASLVTPRTCLLPRPPGLGWQLLAVHDFEGNTVLLRIDWDEPGVTEAGRLPGAVDGGVWLEPPERLALNVIGGSGRSSAFSVDLAAGRFSPLFEASPDTDDRAVLYDPAGGHLVVTTDVAGYPAVGIARFPAGRGVEFLAPISSGDEAGHPVAIVTYRGRPAVLLRHEDGVYARLRLADLETLEISEPLPVPDGEVGPVVTSDGTVVRFAYSAPDRPWRPARLDLARGTFTLDAAADDGLEVDDLPLAHAVSFPGPAPGDMPALCFPAAGSAPGTDLLVIALHGGPIQRWGSEFNAEAALFARLGVPVVALDYPGSTGSGQAFMRSLFGRAGVLDVEAVASVMETLEAETGRRIILYGESYGAFLALATAAARPCAGVVAFAPFASFARLRETGSPEVRDTLELLDSGNSDISGRNLLERCRTIRGKVLIFHGTADRTIPVAESWALAQALRDRDGAGDSDVRYVEMSGQGHELAGRRVLQQWFRELTAFVAALSAPRSSAQ